jgi:hypothetical protein
VARGERPKFPKPDAPQYVVGMLSRPVPSLAAALDYALSEQLRGLAGPFVSLVQRDEHMRHLHGVPHILGLLNTVFLAETGAAPPGKHWNRTFTPEQRAAVAALPPVRAERDSLVTFGLAVAELLLTRARPQFHRYELTWPAEFAAVVATRLREKLGLDVTRWCY